MSITFDEYDLTASVCRESFFQFFVEFWEEIAPGRELVLNWHIEYVCKVMQQAAERVFVGKPKEYDYIFNVPPGTTKSSVASIAFPAYVFTRMPHARVICASHTDTLVMDLSRKCRDVVRSEKYQACFGVVRKYKGQLCKPVIIADDQDTKGYWATTEGGMRFCATVGGRTPTGMHGDFLITDDPTDPKKILSEAEQKDTNLWMRETLPTRKTDKRVSVTFLIMQRLGQADPTGDRLDNKEAGPVRHICLPADNSYEIKPSYLKEKYGEQGLLDPVRLPRSVLDSELGILGEAAFSGQYGQSPISRSGNLFKWEMLNFDAAPHESDLVNIVRYWDTAGEVMDTSPRSAGMKLAKDKKGRFWILHGEVGRWPSERREAIILQTAQRDGRRVRTGVEQQPGSSGKEVAKDTVKRLAGFNVYADRPTGSKEVRAVPFSVQVNNGNVYLPNDNAPWIQPFLDELKFFPAGRFKDMVDACSGAFAELTRRAVVGGVRGL